MTEPEPAKGRIEHAVETLVYAPIGLLFEGPTLLPKLVEDGKMHARNARLFGKLAVQQGQAELWRRVGALEEQASAILRALGVTAEEEAEVHRPPARPAPGMTSGDGAAPTAPAPAAAELAITDYDSLSASQVVSRLAGLASDELEAVRAYEAAHRGRKTILNKVAQLQA